MPMSWTLAFILTFTSCFLCTFIDGKCKCEKPVEVGGDVLVEGLWECNNLPTLQRKWYDDTCTFTKAAINKISSPVAFTKDNLIPPPTGLNEFRLLNMCVKEIQGGFFEKSVHLSSVLFQKLTCLKTLESRVFYGLENLATIRITGGDLTTISNEAFSNLQSLTELKIISTKLKNLPDVLVSGNTKLNDIILHSNEISVLPRTLFKSNFIGDPIKMDLSNNSIADLPSGLFLNLKLKYLNLEGNKLLRPPIQFNSYTFDNIGTLLLGKNQISGFDEQFLQNLTKSRKRTTGVDLDIQGNPWKCSCPSKWIKELGDYPEELRCHSPNRLKGRLLKTLSTNDLCPSTTPSNTGMISTNMDKNGYIVKTDSGGDGGADTGNAVKGASVDGGGPPSQEIVAIGVAVAVIVSGLILIFLLYRFRNKICSKSKSSKAHAAQYHVANSKEPENGYNGDPIARETYVVA